MSVFTRSSLAGRSFLKEVDLTVVEWEGLMDLARELKAEKRDGIPRHRLAGRNIAILFEKASTRTRCAFEVAAHDEGAHITYLDPAGSHLGHKESVADTARVLGRMYDAIEYRGFAQEVVEELAARAGVPVWNGLTDRWHPTQSLCDMLTMTEHVGKPAAEISFAYVGDAHNNVANSLLVAGAMLGMDVRMVAPEDLQNPEQVRRHAVHRAADTGARLSHTADVAEGVAGVDFLYTDVWVSMGEPEEIWRERISKLAPFQVNREMIELTGNPDVKFMHCLPAFHDRRTEVGQALFEATGMTGLEVTDEVFESDRSIVFDQAENRMHTIKAVMVASIGDP